MRLICSYYPKAGVSQTGLDCHTNRRNQHTQMRHLTITLIETTFILYLRAFQGLFHPRTEKYVRRSNIVSKKRSNTKNFVMELSKISRKGTKKTHTHLRRKQAHVAPPPTSANLDSHRFVYHKCRTPHMKCLGWCSEPHSQEYGATAQHFTTYI